MFPTIKKISADNDDASTTIKHSKAKKKSFTSNHEDVDVDESSQGRRSGKFGMSVMTMNKKSKTKEEEEEDEDDDDDDDDNNVHEDRENNSTKLPTKQKKIKKNSFEALGLSDFTMAGIKKLGFRMPTEIQRLTIPLGLSGKDIVAMARTGSGKTAAFMIPVLEKLNGAHSPVIGARAVILSPTRELSQQTHTFSKTLMFATSLRLCLLQGGDSMEAQFEALSNNPDIIIATPGRLVHLLGEVKDFQLSKVQILVLDEADRMFEAGFAGQINELLRAIPTERQTLLFSATMPRQVLEFSRADLKKPEVVRIENELKVSDTLRLAFLCVRSEDSKLAALHCVLSEVLVDPLKEQTIIFVATKHHCDLVVGVLEKCLPHLSRCSVIYGSMDMASRTESLQRFRTMKTNFLVVTDVAARGIDIPLLNNVINFSFPASAKLFVHRVGRAARQGREGVAISLVAPDELPYLFDIHLYLGRSVRFAPQNLTERLPLSKLSPDDVFTGYFPQSIIDTEIARARNAIDTTPELAGVERSAYNAYQLYCKSRPEASRRSFQRSREIVANQEISIHPLLVDSSNPSESLREDSALRVLAIRNYRPKQTIFELDGIKTGKSEDGMAAMMQSKRKAHQNVIFKKTSAVDGNEAISNNNNNNNNNNNSEEADNNNDMKESGRTKTTLEILHSIPALSSNNNSNGEQTKRHLSKAERKKLKRQGSHEPEITSNAKRQKVLLATDNYKDSKHFISYEPSGYNRDMENLLSLQHTRHGNNSVSTGAGEHDDVPRARLEDAVLDMTPDEQADMVERKRMYRWDKKRRNYVKATLKDHAAAGRIKNESGAVVGLKDIKNRGKLYEKWQSKTHKRVGLASTSEDDHDNNTKLSHHQDDSEGNTDVKKISVRHRELRNEEKKKRKESKSGPLTGLAKTIIKPESQIRKEKEKKRRYKPKSAN